MCAWVPLQVGGACDTMAGGVMLVQRTDGKTYTGRLTWYVAFVSLAAGSGGLLFGKRPQNPFRGTPNPFPDAQNPFSGTQSPLTCTQSPFCGTQNPSPGTQNPLTCTRNPFPGSHVIRSPLTQSPLSHMLSLSSKRFRSRANPFQCKPSPCNQTPNPRPAKPPNPCYQGPFPNGARSPFAVAPSTSALIPFLSMSSELWRGQLSHPCPFLCSCSRCC